MFENIIGYESLTTHLKTLIIERALPQVILLSGNPQSGKQTLATEIARALLCNNTGDWYCQCSQCNHCKMLTHQDILFSGYIYGIQEVLCGKKMVLQHQTKRETMFFMRAISKVLRRADFVLWEMQDMWKRNIKVPAEQVRAQLMEYQEVESLWFAEKKINALVQSVEKLYKAFPSQMFPVQCIRNMISWSMMRTSHNAKIIIMNQIEEMLPSASNMMLKTLETPPEQVYFILLSNNSSKVIPTIRSRAREFRLPQRSMETELDILQQVFKYETNQDNTMPTPTISIKAYLDMFSEEQGVPVPVSVSANSIGNDTANNEQHNTIRNYANKYFQAIIHKQVFQEAYINLPTKQNKSMRPYALIFINHLTVHITDLFADTQHPSYFVEKMWRACERSRQNIQHRNINAKLVLETLFYTLTEEYESIQ